MGGRGRLPKIGVDRVVRWANSLDDAVLAHKFPVVRIRCFFALDPERKWDERGILKTSQQCKIRVGISVTVTVKSDF